MEEGGSTQDMRGGTPAESKNKEKNDAKRAAKMQKLQEKQAKAAELAARLEAKKKEEANKPSYAAPADVAVVETPFGEKKDMSLPMSPTYNPLVVESAWYAWWEKSGFFKPECFGSVDDREKFTIVMPPPNVTGSLHIGHATMLAIEDAIVRWHRMHGKAALFVPGCDHAGIATQSVVEKRLAKDRNLTRHDLGRETFVAEVWKWKQQYGDRIYEQVRRMGASADWSRACFTLDDKLCTAVTESFIRLFNDGLIFRANRLVNWCGKLKTSLSDLEVDQMDIAGITMLPAFGHPAGKTYKFGAMTYIAYQVQDGAPGDEIVIGTTRPETLFADTALCVNPNDERYTRFHGRNVIHPILNTPIPIICDEAADMTFGTGALKVSPGHDMTDFALGQKHSLRILSVMDENNVMNEHCGEFAGMQRYEAREAVVEHLKKTGAFRDEQPHAMSLPICSRTGDFIEPRLIPQWWLNCQDMARRSVQAVRDGELEILPKDHEKTWFHWLENIRDWCISRQLWWGHRVPAYRVTIDGQPANDDVWVAARSSEEALAIARKKLDNVDPAKISVAQDEDVLDTWYSSALWPFSTLGWPDESSLDFARFFPNQLLETGSDILFFWVARMAMMSLYLTGQLPFKQIFLHAIVRDAHGRKMSKSLGNVIDPIDVIEGITLAELQRRLEEGNLSAKEVATAKEGQRQDYPDGISQCGTDALRFSLCSYISEGRDINMDVKRVEANRRFCNKLWNACRFALMKLGDAYVPRSVAEHARAAKMGGESLADRWVLARMNNAARDLDAAMRRYNFLEATQIVHGFFLRDLCDTYIEAVKPACSAENTDEVARACALNALYTSLEASLRMFHPFMPFVTEELYQRLPRRAGDSAESISLSAFPVFREDLVDVEAEEAFGRVCDIVVRVRSTASIERVPKRTTITIGIGAMEASDAALLRSQEAAMASLLRSVGQLKLSDDATVSADESTPSVSFSPSE